MRTIARRASSGPFVWKKRRGLDRNCQPQFCHGRSLPHVVSVQDEFDGERDAAPVVLALVLEHVQREGRVIVAVIAKREHARSVMDSESGEGRTSRCCAARNASAFGACGAL